MSQHKGVIWIHIQTSSIFYNMKPSVCVCTRPCLFFPGWTWTGSVHTELIFNHSASDCCAARPPCDLFNKEQTCSVVRTHTSRWSFCNVRIPVRSLEMRIVRHFEPLHASFFFLFFFFGGCCNNDLMWTLGLGVCSFTLNFFYSTGNRRSWAKLSRIVDTTSHPLLKPV